MTRPRHAAGRLALGLLVVSLAACDTTPSAIPSPTATPEPTATTSSYDLMTTVWYAGLVMTFGRATAVLDDRGGSVTVELRLENSGTDDVTLDSPILLVVGGTPIEPTRETVLPSVTAGGSAFTTLHFNVVGETSVDDAILRIGAADRHKAIVPFAGSTTTAVTLEPVELALKGTETAGDLRLALTQGELRWDLPDWADELPSGSASLTLTYDVTYTGSFVGGTAFTGDNIGLMLPDGTFLSPRADGRSQSVTVVGPGKTVRRLATRFEIPANTAGTYTLLLGWNGKQGKLKLTLPG